MKHPLLNRAHEPRTFTLQLHAPCWQCDASLNLLDERQDRCVLDLGHPGQRHEGSKRVWYRNPEPVPPTFRGSTLARDGFKAGDMVALDDNGQIVPAGSKS